MNVLGRVNFSIVCIIFLLEFSVGRCNGEPRSDYHINNGPESIEIRNLKTALQEGEMEQARDIIRTGGLEKYITGYDELKKFKLLEKAYAKTLITELLLKTRIVVINNQENDVMESSPDKYSFEVVLVPDTNLVTELKINVTTIKFWKNSSVKDGKKPLHIICSLPDVLPETVNTVLTNSQDDVNVKSDLNLTPLIFASSAGNLEVVKFLVEKGANINDLALFERPITHVTRHLRYKKIFSNTNIPHLGKYIHFTALDIAAWEDHLDVVLYLLNRGAKINDNRQSWVTLIAPVVNNHIQIVETLLKKGIDVHGRDPLGSTSLHKVAENGNTEMAKLLLKYGADVNATDIIGWTPLHNAAFYSFDLGDPMIQLLLDAGSNIDARTDGGYSILSLVEAGSNMDFLKYLIETFDSLNSTTEHRDLDQDNSNEQRANLISRLLQKGAPLNAQDNILGWSPLHWAAATGDLKVAKLLVKHGAVISTKSFMGLNPLDTAKHFGRKRVADFLRTAKDLVVQR